MHLEIYNKSSKFKLIIFQTYKAHIFPQKSPPKLILFLIHDGWILVEITGTRLILKHSFWAQFSHNPRIYHYKLKC